MGKEDPEYWINLHHARERFLSAIRWVAERRGFDLVMEVGAVQIKPGIEGVYVSDITEEVILQLSR